MNQIKCGVVESRKSKLIIISSMRVGYLISVITGDINIVVKHSFKVLFIVARFEDY